MPDLPDLIRQYSALLEEESHLNERKEHLRAEILAAMGRHDVRNVLYPHGSAQRLTRFKLLPKRDEVLAVLAAADLFDFARFSAEKVKELLVPRYGRERLLPLFDIQKSESLIVKRPQGRQSRGPEPTE